MRSNRYGPAAICLCAILATFFLLPGPPVAAAQTAQPNSQLFEQQRRLQAEGRRALEESERRIAASQAEQIREAQERADQQRRALAEANRRREAEQHYEEFLVQTRARAQQSSAPQSRDEGSAPQIGSSETAVVLPQASAEEPEPLHYLLLRRVGLILMLGASFGVLFVLGRMTREWLAR